MKIQDDKLVSVIQLILLAGTLPPEDYETARRDIADKPQGRKK